MAIPTPVLDEVNETLTEDFLPSPDDAILRMRQEIERGQHWFTTLLDAVGNWKLPVEWIGDREYRYLYGGDAFDWMVLAERLLDEVADLVPRPRRRPLPFLWRMALRDRRRRVRSPSRPGEA